MAKIRWTVGARRDLHEIINYIADDSPAYAINFAERIILAVDRLETFPKLGRIVPEYQIRTYGNSSLAIIESSIEFRATTSGSQPLPMPAETCSENSPRPRGI